MANEKISDLAVAGPLTGTEKVEVVQGAGPGSNKQTTTQDIANLATVTGGVQTVTGSVVDNTDPQNPIIDAASESYVDSGDSFVQSYADQIVSYVPVKQAMDVAMTGTLPAFTAFPSSGPGSRTQLQINALGYFPTTDGVLNDATHTITSVLVWKEVGANAKYNGTYILQDKGSPSTHAILARTLDSQAVGTDGHGVEFAEVLIIRGTANAGRRFRQTTVPIILDTTAQAWIDTRTLTLESLSYALSDELTPLTIGIKLTDRVPYAFHVSSVRISLTTAQTTSVFVTVDIKKNGVSILSTLVSVDNNEKTSVTAVYPVVISTPDFADDDEVQFSVTQVGTATVAAGLKAKLIGYRI